MINPIKRFREYRECIKALKGMKRAIKSKEALVQIMEEEGPTDANELLFAIYSLQFRMYDKIVQDYQDKYYK